MKISKQEQIVIIVLLVLAILGVGIFIFILPNFNNISVNNKNLDSVKEEYAELEAKLEHEKTIDDEIKAAYEEGKDLANTFYDDLTPYEADEIMRQFIAKGKDITISGLNISPFSTETLSVSVFTPSDVTYPLKDFADTVVTADEEEKIGAESLSATEKAMLAKKLTATKLASSEAVTVGVADIKFTATSNKLQNLHDFTDMLNEGIYDEKILGSDGKPQRKATFVNGVVFQITEKNAADKAAEGESEDAAQTSGVYTMEFNVKMYCIKPVADPFAAQEE